jgi:hypothetical protein
MQQGGIVTDADFRRIPTYLRSVPSDPRSVPSDQPAPLWPSLQTIAAPVSSASRVERAVIEEVILKLCKRRFLTLKELAALLNRSADKLRMRYLTDLVRSHALELRFPNAPNTEAVLGKP